MLLLFPRSRRREVRSRRLIQSVQGPGNLTVETVPKAHRGRLCGLGVRCGQHDDRAQGVPDAPRRHRADQDVVHPAEAVAAYDQQGRRFGSLDQPVHGRPVYHPCFDCDVFVVWRQGVELLILCRLGRLPRVRADRGLGEPAAVPTVPKGGDHFQRPAAVSPLP